jgi:hypothetical protein
MTWISLRRRIRKSNPAVTWTGHIRKTSNVVPPSSLSSELKNWVVSVTPRRRFITGEDAATHDNIQILPTGSSDAQSPNKCATMQRGNTLIIGSAMNGWVTIRRQCNQGVRTMQWDQNEWIK